MFKSDEVVQIFVNLPFPHLSSPTPYLVRVTLPLHQSLSKFGLVKLGRCFTVKRGKQKKSFTESIVNLKYSKM